MAFRTRFIPASRWIRTYAISLQRKKKVPIVYYALDQALNALDKDREFLKTGGVFTDDTIDAYIELKIGEVNRLRMTTHPIEFDMYYSM
jgi:glutamine synthetase